MVHSDMGSQYTNNLFEKTLVQANLKHSYSREGSVHLIMGVWSPIIHYLKKNGLTTMSMRR